MFRNLKFLSKAFLYPSEQIITHQWTKNLNLIRKQATQTRDKPKAVSLIKHFSSQQASENAIEPGVYGNLTGK